MSNSTRRDDHFDWLDEENENIVVLRHQPQTAVYTNPYGEVVIRQEGHYGPDEDQFVHIAPRNVPAVVQAMLARVSDEQIVQEEVKKDPTAADRQRRRRQKTRDGHGGVTGDERDGPVPVTLSDRDADAERDRDMPLLQRDDG